MFDRAYQLAYFILRRQDLALRATEEALCRVDVAMASQDKRLYYEPARGGSPPKRRKVWLDEAHQLQRLIYGACEEYERARERGALEDGVGQEDLVLHFVKHLVRITVRRNAFHVILGVSRLLFSYPTAATMDIHNQLAEGPEDVKDESYYRARKAVLMDELRDRFGSLLSVVRQHRGEERFLPLEDSRPHLPFVAECLDRFTPWSTPCWGRRPSPTDGRPEVELERIHAALHPPCLQALVDALRLEGLAGRLALPRFNLPGPGGQDDMTDRHRVPASLTPAQEQRIEASLGRSSRARSRAPAGLLRIVVDGQECGRLDLAVSGELSVALPEESELLEVWAVGAGEEVLLATALLGANTAPALSITLEAGQRLTARLAGASGSSRGTRIEISYRETRSWRALGLAARRARHRLGQVGGSGWRLGWSALALALLATAAVQLRQPSPGPGADRSPAAVPALPAANDRVTSRSAGAPSTVVTDLREVRGVFVEVTGDAALREAAHTSFAAGLKASRFAVVTDKDVADAALKVQVRSAAPPDRSTPPKDRSVRIVVRVVNAEGAILWPRGLTRGGREAQGPLGAVADRLLRELLADSSPR